LPTGAQITGRPMQLIGCVSRPRFGRAGISRRGWEHLLADLLRGRGVAGARITSTVSNSFITCR
jgi:hypothetical protein